MSQRLFGEDLSLPVYLPVTRTALLRVSTLHFFEAGPLVADVGEERPHRSI